MNPERYDTIVIGAGHNGLICATYLARSGQRVLVLEANDAVGGLAARHEFHPGFHASVAHTSSHFPDKIARDLKLQTHGLESFSDALQNIGLAADGKHVVVDGGSVEGAGDSDASAYGEYLKTMQRFAVALEPFWLKTMRRAEPAASRQEGHAGVSASGFIANARSHG